MNSNPKMGFKWDGVVTGYRKGVPIAISEAMLKVASKRIVREIQAEIRKADRVDTGELLNSWETDHSLTALGPSITVFSNAPQARWVDQGTGIWGPKGQPITRPGGGAMKFNPGKRNSGSAQPGVGRRKATNQYGKGGQFTGSVYAMSVQGQQGVNYIQKVRERMNVSWFLNPLG